MRQRILGVVGLVSGAAIVVFALVASHGVTSSSGSYHAGQIAGVVFGALFLIVGGRAVLKSLR